MQEERKVIWSPEGNDKLEEFLRCPAKEILFGGAAGGGKTEGLVASAIGPDGVGLFWNPGWRVLILRRTLKQIDISQLEVRARALFGDRGKYNENKHLWTFPGGGILQFGHIKNPNDIYNYDSAEFCLIMFDELTQFTEYMYTYMFSRLRTVDSRIETKIKSATNPGNMGHGWVKRRFIDGRNPGEIYDNIETLPNGTEINWTRCFIPSRVEDNKILMKRDPGYVRALMELPEVEKQAKLYGNWDIFSGQFFTEFTEDHICDDFDFPDEWPVWISMDWGPATKTAVGFYTEDMENRVVYRFDELYLSETSKHGTTLSDVAKMVKDRLGKRLGRLMGRYADRRIMTKDSDTNVSIQDKFAWEGLYFTVVTNERVPGWHNCRELLMKDRDGIPRFYVMRKCQDFIRVIPEMIFDDTNREDMRHKSGDETHIPDEFRYFCVSRHAKPEPGKTARVELSPVTGYPCQGEGVSYRHTIRRRLASHVPGRNYFYTR